MQILQAQAQAEPIRMVNEELARNPKYLDYLQVQKWDGKYPSNVLGGTLSVTVPLPSQR